MPIGQIMDSVIKNTFKDACYSKTNAKRSMVVTFVLSMCLSGSAAIFSWESGVIMLPNGQIAGMGDVKGMAWANYSNVWSTREMFALSDSAFYDAVRSGDPSSLIGKGGLYEITQSAVSDATGTCDIEDLNMAPCSQWAVVLYTCVIDGQEYYKRVNASNYRTGPSTSTDPLMQQVYSKRYTQLASYSDWKLGYAVPEPSSGLLVFIGFATLALRRRQS